MHRLATSLVASVFFTSAGCAIIAGLDGERYVGQSATTASASSSSSSGAGGGGGSDAAVCSPALPPAPPTIMGAGGADVLTFAMRKIELGGPKKNVGFDLDGQCTCPGKTGCQEPAWAKGEHCDEADGRDNGSGNAFTAINEAFAPLGVISSSQLSQQANSGAWSLLVNVSGYNGGVDDDQVEVALYATPGLGPAAPKWDGTDAWPVAPLSLVDQISLNQPINKDAKAYVTNRVLVAHLPGATLVFQSPGVHLQVDLISAVFSATLEAKDSGAVRLTEGTMSARWSTPTLFKNLSDLRVNGNTTLCVGDTFYSIVKSALCEAVDLSSTGTPGADCDALSFSVGFEASPALLGAVEPLLPLNGTPCPMATDPATDVCGS
jgi:hypothetical protein